MAADRYTRLVEDIHREFAGFRLVRKDRSWFQRAIHYALVAVTLGGMRRYLDSYQTTIGKTLYVTPDWNERDVDERYVTLCHERVHLRQFRRYTLPVMAVLYLLLPLPVGLAYFRAHFEREAYSETLRSAASVHGIEHIRDAHFRGRIVKQFLGPSYGWMWPFPRRVNAWYDREVERVTREMEGRR